MTLTVYTGYSPMRVSRDAKYTVTATGAIRLEYQESRRVRVMLTTEDHPELVEMVNAIKNEINSREGGQFYINEFHHVLVPDGKGGSCYYAGFYDDVLEFREGDLIVTPAAPDDLRPGDDWPGPHVGIPYVLNAGATDIRYEMVDGPRRTTVLLSDERGRDAAQSLAQRLGKIKGTSGGRFFVNEAGELFAPVGIAGDWTYLYLGDLGEDAWFPPPAGYDA
jgi:hypothetical protein